MQEETEDTSTKSAESTPETEVTADANTDTANEVSGDTDKTPTTDSETEKSGTGNNDTGAGDAVKAKKRVQFSVRTDAGNKEYFDTIWAEIKKTNPDATADEVLTFIFELSRMASVQLPALNKENEELKRQVSFLKTEPPKEKIVEKEVVKEVPVKLEANQVLVSFDPKLMDMIRKCRPFLKKKKILEWNNDSEFVSQLVSKSTLKFLKYHCDDILNPL